MIDDPYRPPETLVGIDRRGPDLLVREIGGVVGILVSLVALLVPAVLHARAYGKHNGGRPPMLSAEISLLHFIERIESHRVLFLLLSPVLMGVSVGVITYLTAAALRRRWRRG